MYAEERRGKILAMLEQTGRVDSAELARIFDTSRETIRRDIAELGDRGLLIKTHGGAIAPDKGEDWNEPPLSMRLLRNTPEKSALCTYAAGFVKARDVLYLDNSTTVAGLLRRLPKTLELTILTNSLKLAVESAKYEGNQWEMVSMGGQLSGKTLSSGGFLAEENLRMFHPTKAFLSCQALDETLEVTDSFSTDLQLKRQVIHSAQQRFLLVDHTKLGRAGIAVFAKAANFDHILTTEGAEAAFLSRLRETGVQVHVVPVAKEEIIS